MNKATHRFDPPGPLPVMIDPGNVKEPFILAADFTYEGPVAKVKVPKGFRYDLASVPRGLWWFIPRTDPRIVRAATIHDKLYADRKGDRVVADAVFLSIMKYDKMPAFKRWAAYLAVRLCGERAWRT